MKVDVPTLAATGVPARRPVLVLNVVHAGLFQMPKRSASFAGFDTVGVKE